MYASYIGLSLVLTALCSMLAYFFGPEWTQHDSTLSLIIGGILGIGISIDYLN